jgi:hypothetical protein
MPGAPYERGFEREEESYVFTRLSRAIWCQNRYGYLLFAVITYRMMGRFFGSFTPRTIPSLPVPAEKFL